MKISLAQVRRTRTRLLIIDSNEVSNEGLRAILNRDGRFEFCDPTEGKKTMAELLKLHYPELLLIEPFHHGGDGVLLIKGLAANFPKTRILVVSQKPEDIYAERILRAGARGYWMKSGSCEELIHAVETVLSGELYVSPRLALMAVHRLVEAPRSDISPIGGLTDRELHVFGLIGAGHGTGRIAAELGISRKTVETYQEHIKVKLGYSDASELREGARRWVESLHG